MTADKGHIWLGEISEGEQINGCYLVKDKRVGTTRTGNPFISITLADRSGDMEAKVWDRAREYAPLFDQGDLVEVAGITESFRGQVQMNVSRLSVSDRDMDPGVFMESTPGNVSEMVTALKDILKAVEDRHLKTLCDRFLMDRKFMEMFTQAPAAKNFHHGYLGGLLEHTLSVCTMAQRVLELYDRLDRDLLLSGAFLHDIGKVRELSWNGRIDYTDEGRLLGHVTIGAAMVDAKIIGIKGFPDPLALRLKHLILSHHGQYDFGSPKRPKFLEAFALHLVDDLDAKMNGLGRIMDKDPREGAWTDYNRMFERYLLKGRMASSEEPSEGEIQEADAQATLFAPRKE
ncbi:MAG: HD domain-containing protein [Deltaproteobacteria bacterium]|nr:HD domain-containing protein [Deltaproteobacteria bacterium]MBW2283765.1 HD domain-containing protein [Deltaproteobacteria bacterium]